MQAMSDLVARRSQLLNMQTMEKNRLQILPKELAMTIVNWHRYGAISFAA
jgi:transposase